MVLPCSVQNRDTQLFRDFEFLDERHSVTALTCPREPSIDELTRSTFSRKYRPSPAAAAVLESPARARADRLRSIPSPPPLRLIHFDVAPVRARGVVARGRPRARARGTRARVAGTRARVVGPARPPLARAPSRWVAPGRRWVSCAPTTTTREAANDETRSEWETVVGLEMHVQVGANTKLFSGCVTVSPLEPPPPPGANAPARARGRGAAVGTRDPRRRRDHIRRDLLRRPAAPSLPHHITPRASSTLASAPRGIRRTLRTLRTPGERSGERSDERSGERADRFASARVAAFDAAFPGALPALNAGAVALAARLGVALGGDVQLVSSFDRKHYHYPDLPHGYQITQQRAPIVVGGRIEFFHPDASKSGAAAGEGDGGNDPVGVRRLGVERIQLEMDTGKSSSSSLSRDATTLLDLNRAGAALVEIVTAPDLRSGEEAAAAVASLRETLRFLGVSDANMEDGSLRCDVNVSVRRRGEAALGERCEVKNLNSLRAIRDAVRHEASRQATASIARREPARRGPRSTRDRGARRSCARRRTSWITGSRPSLTSRPWCSRASTCARSRRASRNSRARRGRAWRTPKVPTRSSPASPKPSSRTRRRSPITRGRSRPRAGVL